MGLYNLMVYISVSETEVMGNISIIKDVCGRLETMFTLCFSGLKRMEMRIRVKEFQLSLGN